MKCKEVDQWPSYVWSILRDDNLLREFGQQTRGLLIAYKWRPWLIKSVSVIPKMETITIEEPASLFREVPIEAKELNTALKELRLVLLKNMLTYI